MRMIKKLVHTTCIITMSKNTEPEFMAGRTENRYGENHVKYVTRDFSFMNVIMTELVLLFSRKICQSHVSEQEWYTLSVMKTFKICPILASLPIQKFCRNEDVYC